ncbi:MAG: signal peptidase II [Gammaproteobacteria bacterium]
MQSRSFAFALYMAIALLVVVLSQAIGFWVDGAIPIGQSVEFSSLVHFTHVRNYGGVFGMAQGMGWLFALISVGLLIGVSAYLWFGKQIDRIEYICFGFIVGGGASNILDRFIHGSVIDFIDVQHIPGWNYVFNTADVMVHVGIWPLLFYSFFIAPKKQSQTNS